MRVSGAWLSGPAACAVFDAFERTGKDIFVVGGCVRNSLLGVPVTDIDMATVALPEDVIGTAADAGLRTIPTGMAHGTVTVMSHGIPIEVTTFRRDVSTDGRRATIAFTDDLEVDARRRDFTINALYADRHGRVLDPVGGMSDIEQRTVRFIDDPEARIREDYLRILRYFRFFAWYGDPTSGMDEDALAAIAETQEGLANLSKERVTAEMIKLLSAPDPAPAVATMEHLGVLGRVLGHANSRTLPRLVHWQDRLELARDPMTRLVALGAAELGTHLRLSRAQEKVTQTLAKECSSMRSPGALGYHHGSDLARQILALRCASFETPPDARDMHAISRGAEARFPIAAADLMPGLSGPELGQALRRLEDLWIASDFALSRESLLDAL